MEREKGVLSQPCRVCGEPRMMTEQRDGSLTVEPCTSCSPETEKAAVAPPPPAPEQVMVRETGTDPFDDADGEGDE